LKYHTSHGEISVTLTEDGGSSGEDVEDSSKSDFFLHGLMMWISWFVFGFVQLASNRWFIHISKNLPIIHALSGLFITFCTFFFALKIIVKYGLALDNIHAIIGFLILCCIGLVSLGGMAVGYTKKTAQWNTQKIRNIKIVHRSFGFLMWLLGLVAITLGLKSYTAYNAKDYTYLWYLNAGGMVLIFLGCELAYRNMRSGEDPWVSQSTIMTE